MRGAGRRSRRRPGGDDWPPVVFNAGAPGVLGAAGLKNDPREGGEERDDGVLRQGGYSAAELIRRDAQGLDNGQVGELDHLLRRLVATELDVAQAKLAGESRICESRRIDEQAHGRDEGREELKNLSGTFQRDIARGGGIEDDADGVGAGVGGGQRVLGTRDATDLDACAGHAAGIVTRGKGCLPDRGGRRGVRGRQPYRAYAAEV